ncbi:MAG: hypothetical protein IJP37_05870 [Clostridia bacterium]|nr:hypothetical protein [Clostridia bacterium]
MKKWLAVLLTVVCVLSAVGCSVNGIQGEPVFATENISRILFFGQPDEERKIPVKEPYLAEITEWLSTFRIGDKVKGDALPPGSNSYSVRIEYSDGTFVENGLSTVTRDGVTYEIEKGETPDCWFDLFEGNE